MLLHPVLSADALARSWRAPVRLSYDRPVSAALRELAAEAPPPEDVVLAIVDRRRHQLDLWRVVSRPMMTADLRGMIEVVVRTLLPDRRHRATPAEHPYTIHGLRIDIVHDDGRWVEIGECGVAEPRVLRDAGLDTRRWSGLAMRIGLDRIRTAIDDGSATLVGT